MNKNYFLLLLILIASVVSAQQDDYIHEMNIPYYSVEKTSLDTYIQERSVLDVYCPKDKKPEATIIWIHGGGLHMGNKYLPNSFKKKGVCLIAVSYRLYPKVVAPTHIEDAAAAVAWVFNNIERYGGDKSKVFVVGHSAGAWLTAMLSFEKKWLAANGIDANALSGVFLLSGKAATMNIVKNKRDKEEFRMVINDLAPLYHARKDMPPLMLITGDRELDLPGVYEENALLMRIMKTKGHTQTSLHELGGFGHQITQAAFPLVLSHVREMVKSERL